MTESGGATKCVDMALFAFSPKHQHQGMATSTRDKYLKDVGTAKGLVDMTMVTCMKGNGIKTNPKAKECYNLNQRVGLGT
mmetsp:Transcript_123172/g.213595  ORF Transcript_123172/g.213595 Transcript_123172/m.213595 type:complete len:80 (+) Transcript_123172:215-454(+)